MQRGLPFTEASPVSRAAMLEAYMIVHRMQTEAEAKVIPDRRERFREYMRKLNPTAPAEVVIDLGLAVQTLHGALYQTLAARADLDPGSQQIIVGGIGSGKTTELVMAERWLNERGQTLCLYIDVPSETDLSALNSGALLAGFGSHLLSAFTARGLDKQLPEEQRSSLRSIGPLITQFAYGKTETVRVSVTRTTPGKLQPLYPALCRDIQQIRHPLEEYLGALQSKDTDVVVLFDGLDRLITPDKFWSVVHQDLGIFRQLKVAVIAAAPLSVLYGNGRPVSEHFDRVHHVPTLPAGAGKTSHLRSVLIHRGANELLRNTEIDRICRVSGGVLRDLITLARDAGESAYMDGSDEIMASHVKAAARQLGEGYLRGLNTDQLKILRKLSRDRVFDITSPGGIEMLVTRRVLEYSATDFRVHPALEPLLAANRKNA